MSAGFNVEDSSSSELTGLLKKRGLDATFKKSYITPSGRREPDIAINTPLGLVLVEAKVPPAGLPRAMSQVSEYEQSVGAVEKIRAVFAVVYADRIHKNFEVYFKSASGADLQLKLKSISSVADYIIEKLAEVPVAAPAPLSTQKVIGILNQGVELLSASLAHTTTEEIEGIFGGRDFFSTVLDLEEEKNVSDEALKNAASYLLVNQILFYQILARETTEYPRLDPKTLFDGRILQEKYFNQVLKKDYKAIFGFGIASTIRGEEQSRELRDVVSAIQLLSPESITHDLLGKIFHNLIPLHLRKIVAAYYTNSEAAELLAHLAIEKKSDRVFDPACGSGTLLVATYNRKKALFERFGDEQHTRFLDGEIYGADIMPFAAHLAAVNLALQAPLRYSNKVNVAICDSTSLSPGTEISSAQETIRESYKPAKLSDFEDGKYNGHGKKTRKGMVDLLEEERDLKLPKFDVVIMNPPFTRFQRIPPSFKKKLAERFGQARYREIIHGQLGLHGYFLLLADKFIAPGGRLAAVLPLTTISLEGFYGLIKLLLENYQIEHVIVSSGRAAFSENTSLREILLVARKEAPVPETRTKFTFIHASPEELTVEKARQIAESILKYDDNCEGDGEDTEDYYIRMDSQANYARDVRDLYKNVVLHSPQLVKTEERIKRYFRKCKQYYKLHEAEAEGGWKISENPRGVEEKGYYALSLLAPKDGAKAFKDHDVWLVESESQQILKVRHRFNGAEFRIPRNCVMPQFRRFSGQASIVLNEPRDYLIIRKFDEFEEFLKASALADSDKQMDIRSAIRNGDWEKFVIRNSARTFAFYRGNVTAPNTNLMAVRSNEPTFAGPGGSWVFSEPQTHDKLTALWLNTSIAFYHIFRDRKETEGGFMELDKYVFRAMPSPRLDAVDIKKLDALESKLSRVEFPSLLEQFQTGFASRKELDLFFLDLAGVERKEAERFLDSLYETLAKELLRLKGVMGK